MALSTTTLAELGVITWRRRVMVCSVTYAAYIWRVMDTASATAEWKRRVMVFSLDLPVPQGVLEVR
jgi:hypothetical protein